MELKDILQRFLEHYESLLKLIHEESEDAHHDPDNDMLNMEYNKLRDIGLDMLSSDDYSRVAGTLDANRKKNRYRDIIPFDATRVKIKSKAGVIGSDYVNASFVKGVKGDNAYIAAQGPLPRTVNDFWRMIWEQETKVIVMACNVIEGSKIKCEQYWPEDEFHEKDFDGIKVKLKGVDERDNGDFVVRRLQASCGDQHRTVMQFHYTAWPDHGIPHSMEPILDLLGNVRAYQPADSPPIVVHCSAGCGRTGTLLAIDYVWNLLKSNTLSDEISVLSILVEMRKQRQSLVQTREQYEVVYRCILSLFEKHVSMLGGHVYENVTPVSLSSQSKPTQQMLDTSALADDILSSLEMDSPVTEPRYAITQTDNCEKTRITLQSDSRHPTSLQHVPFSQKDSISTPVKQKSIKMREQRHNYQNVSLDGDHLVTDCLPHSKPSVAGKASVTSNFPTACNESESIYSLAQPIGSPGSSMLPPTGRPGLPDKRRATSTYRPHTTKPEYLARKSLPSGAKPPKPPNKPAATKIHGSMERTEGTLSLHGPTNPANVQISLDRSSDHYSTVPDYTPNESLPITQDEKKEANSYSYAEVDYSKKEQSPSISTGQYAYADLNASNKWSLQRVARGYESIELTSSNPHGTTRAEDSNYYLQDDISLDDGIDDREPPPPLPEKTPEAFLAPIPHPTKAQSPKLPSPVTHALEAGGPAKSGNLSHFLDKIKIPGRRKTSIRRGSSTTSIENSNTVMYRGVNVSFPNKPNKPTPAGPKGIPLKFKRKESP